MSDSGSFTLNLTEFEKRLVIMDVKVNKIAKFAMFEAAAALKKDADEIVPKTPHLWGNLRGDAQRGVKVTGSGTTRNEWFPKITGEDLGVSKLSVLVTYCAPYASRWHETTDNINWSEPGVGPKYLEAKIARKDLRDKYFGLIAQRIKEGLPE